MFKKLFLLICLLNFIPNFVLADEIMIKVTPVKTITTSNKYFQEGDTVEFKVVNTVNDVEKGDKIMGIVKSLTPNGFFGEQASIFIDDFKLIKNQKKLDGNIYVKGNEHNNLSEYSNIENAVFPIPLFFVRGGEVTLKPNKNTYMLYMEN